MNEFTFNKPFAPIKTDVHAGGPAAIRAVELWWATTAAALIPISLIWDYSWESTIGIDRF